MEASIDVCEGRAWERASARLLFTAWAMSGDVSTKGAPPFAVAANAGAPLEPGALAATAVSKLPLAAGRTCAWR